MFDTRALEMAICLTRGPHCSHVFPTGRHCGIVQCLVCFGAHRTPKSSFLRRLTSYLWSSYRSRLAFRRGFILLDWIGYCLYVFLSMIDIRAANYQLANGNISESRHTVCVKFNFHIRLHSVTCIEECALFDHPGRACMYDISR